MKKKKTHYENLYYIITYTFYIKNCIFFNLFIFILYFRFTFLSSFVPKFCTTSYITFYVRDYFSNNDKICWFKSEALYTMEKFMENLWKKKIDI